MYHSGKTYITNMYDIRAALLFLVVLTPLCFGNADPLSTLSNRIEALERRDQEQSGKIDTLEQQVSLSNNKLTLFSELNEDLQKDLAAKTRLLAEQDDIIAALQKDVELQKSEANDNRRRIEILEQKVGAKLDVTDKMFVQLETNLDELNDIKAPHTHTVCGSLTDHLRVVDSSIGGDTHAGSSSLHGEPSVDNDYGKSELKDVQADHEFVMNKIYSIGSDIAGKHLGKLIGNTQDNRILKPQHKERHPAKRFVANGVQEGPVAFHAIIAKRLVQHLGIDQNIVFETVNLNLGGGYHDQHGLFIAPKSGLYIFSTSILSYVNAKAEFDTAIVKNGNILAAAYGHGDSGRHDQGSVTVVTQLNLGDEVSVKIKNVADDSLWGDKHCSFMGLLVVEM